MSAADGFRLLLCAGVLTTSLCFTVLAVKGLYRIVPLFAIYLMFVVLSTSMAIFNPGPEEYRRFYMVSEVLGYLIELAVIWEIGRHIVASLNYEIYRILKTANVIVLTVFIAVGIGVALASHFEAFERLPKELLTVDTAFQMFRTLVLLVLLALSTCLSLRWRYPAVRIAALFSFYSATALAARAVEEYGINSPSFYPWFQLVDRITIIVWCLVMVALSLLLATSQWNQPQTGAEARAIVALHYRQETRRQS